MNSEAHELPDFENPPVTEVVLMAQFEPLEEMQSAHLGLLWSRYRSRFPKLEEQPPLPPMAREDLTGKPRPIEVKVEMMSTPTAPRLLFISESGTELVQVQNDRFIANWRRTQEEDVYPRYEHVRGYFEDGFREFLSFVEEEQLGEVSLRQCELTYLNQIPAGLGWERFGEIHRVLSVWSDELVEAIPEPEAASVSLQFLIPEPGEQARGRMYVDVRPSIRNADQHPLFAMNITARVPGVGGGAAEPLECLDLAHEWIVRGFAAVTTKEMHEIWGRRDART